MHGIIWRLALSSFLHVAKNAGALQFCNVSFPKRMELPWPCGTATGDIVQVDQQGGMALIVALAQYMFEKKQLPIAKCISWLVNLPLPNAPLPRK